MQNPRAHSKMPKLLFSLSFRHLCVYFSLPAAFILDCKSCVQEVTEFPATLRMQKLLEHSLAFFELEAASK